MLSEIAVKDPCYEPHMLALMKVKSQIALQKAINYGTLGGLATAYIGAAILPAISVSTPLVEVGASSLSTVPSTATFELTAINASQGAALTVGISSQVTPQIAAIACPKLPKALSNLQPVDQIQKLKSDITNWLGKNSRLIYNESRDLVFISEDGLRRVRFDFNNSSPHHSPHAHVEMKTDGRWIKSGPIYPIDMPHH